MGKGMSYLTLKTDPVAIAPGTDLMTIVAIAPVAIAPGNDFSSIEIVASLRIASRSLIPAAVDAIVFRVYAAMRSVPGAVATGSVRVADD